MRSKPCSSRLSSRGRGTNPGPTRGRYSLVHKRVTGSGSAAWADVRMPLFLLNVGFSACRSYTQECSRPIWVDPHPAASSLGSISCARVSASLRAMSYSASGLSSGTQSLGWDWQPPAKRSRRCRICEKNVLQDRLVSIIPPFRLQDKSRCHNLCRSRRAVCGSEGYTHPDLCALPFGAEAALTITHRNPLIWG